MKLLMTIPCLRTGGAEWAFIRQANALVAAGHQVTCYVPYRCDSEATMLRALSPRVLRVHLPLMTAWLHRLLYKLTLMLPRLNLEQRIHSTVLRWMERTHRFDAVNPHLRAATVMVCGAFEHSPVRVIESDHGDYGLLKEQDPHCTQPDHSLLMRRVDAIVCPSQANVERLKTFPWKRQPHLHVVPYAMESVESRARPDGAFTFGMIARGVPEKGWAQAIEAFRIVRTRVTHPIRLLLVGEGAEIARLRRERSDEKDIEFVGHQSDSAAWIARFDVGLLPTYFAAESLPCAIIECLVQSKPVIGTNIGGIPEMIRDCGLLVPISEGKADVARLAEAMQRLVSDAELRSQLAGHALRAAQRYSPAAVAAEYRTIFARVSDCRSAQVGRRAIVLS
jgi:L-malate glycosyltransferase